MDFSGHNAIVTGGKGALGKAVVRGLLDAAASVVVPVRPGTLAGAGGKAPSELPCDVTREEDVRAFVQAAREMYGDPDILVHAAGGYAGGMRLEETPAEVWDDMFSKNLRSGFLFCRELLPRMRRKGFGRIVLVSAFSAIRTGGGNAAYAASKRGLLTMMDVLSEEIKGTGITVNAVAPSILRTEANRQAMPGSDEKKWVALEDAAASILMLCSADSGGINGTTLIMRGGV